MIALFTIFELEQLSDNQLNHLHHILNRLLMTTEPNSPDRRNILATLENIEIVLGQKPIQQIRQNWIKCFGMKSISSRMLMHNRVF